MIYFAGSCSFEGFEEGMAEAAFLQSKGINYLRAMLWKPRTKKTAFQGVGVDGIKDLHKIKEKYPNITFIIEVMDEHQVEAIMRTNLKVVFQIGARNSQNYSLLKYLGSFSGLNIIYKRGPWMTIDEFVAGADYLEPTKNKIALCLRGVSTTDSIMRNMPDLADILVLKRKYKFTKNPPYIFFDPSHSSGDRTYIHQLSLAAQVLGADGLEIEIHSFPNSAISDGAQTIDFKTFELILNDIKTISNF